MVKMRWTWLAMGYDKDRRARSWQGRAESLEQTMQKLVAIEKGGGEVHATQIHRMREDSDIERACAYTVFVEGEYVAEFLVREEAEREARVTADARKATAVVYRGTEKVFEAEVRS